MAIFSIKSFTDRNSLARISPGHLVKLLKKNRKYFVRRGLQWPDIHKPDFAFDLDRLAEILATPEQSSTDFPSGLADALWAINDVANSQGMDAILASASAMKIKIHGASAIDVAVEAWLHNKQWVEEIQAELRLTHARSFEYHRPKNGKLLQLYKITKKRIKAFESDLAHWFGTHNRGRAAKAHIFQTEQTLWVSIRHGEPVERHPVLNGSKPGSVVFRPQKFDTVAYDLKTGDLRIHAKSPNERTLYAQSIGKHFFGSLDLFEPSHKYTLEPITNLGRQCLACQDIQGIRSITLIEVTYRTSGNPPAVRKIRSSNLFMHLESRNEKTSDLSELTQAKFGVMFDESKSQRIITVTPPGKVDCAREEDAEAVEDWLQARGFIRSDELQKPTPLHQYTFRHQSSKSMGRLGEDRGLFNQPT